MATIQIFRPATTTVVQEKVQVRVLIKYEWTDEWEEFPYLVPVSASACAAPSISRAEFIWHYGRIQHEDATAKTDETPIPFTDFFVQIRTLDSRGERTLWTGFVAESQLSIAGAAAGGAPSGDQHLVAWGLEHFLDRVPVRQAWVETAPGHSRPSAPTHTVLVSALLTYSPAG